MVPAYMLDNSVGEEPTPNFSLSMKQHLSQSSVSHPSPQSPNQWGLCAHPCLSLCLLVWAGLHLCPIGPLRVGQCLFSF